MKFHVPSLPIIGIAIAACKLAVTVHAWSPVTSVARSSSFRPGRFATPVTAQDAAEPQQHQHKTLSPAFQQALTMATTRLQDIIPQPYHDKMLPGLLHFVQEYVTASQDAYHAGNQHDCHPPAVVQRILTAIGYGLQFGVQNKYQFDVSHTAMRGHTTQGKNSDNSDSDNAAQGIDFYAFGCDFFRPVMDLERSVVLGQDNLAKAVQQLEAGENVVLLANHQSEADPQVVSCCLEKAGFATQAEDMVYVAGHKVTTDTLAIPFSMGRNLICIHSKKHINADKDTKPVKQRQNLKAMQALLTKFKQGGALIWVAPSGGRDRRDLTTGKVPIAPFDSKTIDMFRLMGNKVSRGRPAVVC